MKKAHYRDYATEAFRFLAREGSSEKYRQRIWNEAIERQRKREAGGGISCPTEAAIMRADQAIADAYAELADLEAAEWALNTLEKKRGRGAVKAVKIVYMTAPNLELERGDIANRAHAAEITIPAGTATIYRWLRLARDLFAEKRGLRT